MEHKCNWQLSEERFVVLGHLPMSASVQSAAQCGLTALWAFGYGLTFCVIPCLNNFMICFVFCLKRIKSDNSGEILIKHTSTKQFKVVYSCMK